LFCTRQASAGVTLRREQGFGVSGDPWRLALKGVGHDEPLDKERSSFLLKSLLLYS